MNVAACCCLLRVLCCIAELDFVPLYANNYVKACENVLVLAGCLDALLPKRLVLFRLIMHAMYLFFGKLLNAQRGRERAEFIEFVLFSTWAPNVGRRFPLLINYQLV